MKKSIQKGGPFGIFTFFSPSAGKLTEDSENLGHAEAFNQLQCPDIHQAPDQETTLFGSHERPLGAPDKLFPKSKKAAASQMRRGTPSASPIFTWRRLLKTLAAFGPKGQIAGVNSFINSQADVSGIAAGGKTKSWAKPLNVFKCGDESEDYAMAKYVSLRLLGFHPDRLRMVWLEEDGSDIHHAVLSVNLRGNVFILDSRTDIISTDKMLSEGHPFCSLNGARFSLHWDDTNPDGPSSALEKMANYAEQLEAA